MCNSHTAPNHDKEKPCCKFERKLKQVTVAARTAKIYVIVKRRAVHDLKIAGKQVYDGLKGQKLKTVLEDIATQH